MSTSSFGSIPASTNSWTDCNPPAAARLVTYSSASPARESKDVLCRAAEFDGMQSIPFKCSCRDSVLRLIDPFEFTVGHQELGQTHHPHPVEVRRLSGGTSHRLRCVLAFRSVQDDVSNQPYRRSEGCCLKDIQLFQRVTSVSTRRLRSWQIACR